MTLCALLLLERVSELGPVIRVSSGAVDEAPIRIASTYEEDVISLPRWLWSLRSS